MSSEVDPGFLKGLRQVLLLEHLVLRLVMVVVLVLLLLMYLRYAGAISGGTKKTRGILEHLGWKKQGLQQYSSRACQSLRPPDQNLRTLGWLKHLGDPAFEFLEHLHLKHCHKALTEDWWLIQAGTSEEAHALWLDLCKLMELDKKATLDLMLLATSGVLGRTCTNIMMWGLLSNWGIQPPLQGPQQQSVGRGRLAQEDL